MYEGHYDMKRKRYDDDTITTVAYFYKKRACTGSYDIHQSYSSLVGKILANNRWKRPNILTRADWVESIQSKLDTLRAMPASSRMIHCFNDLVPAKMLLLFNTCTSILLYVV